MSPPDLPDLRTRGRWPPPEGPRVAIVGSRRPSPYGEAAAEQLALELARASVTVISGLALGIDAAAHRGALNGGGVTVAVMGTGVDVIYPSAHVVLAEAILAAGGALVSQFPDGTTPRRHHFPARNYTMAALADVVVVVEAAEGSGALITADAALDLHKEVMAVPGSIFSPLSVGAHSLIRDGAGLVQNSRDVMAALGVGGEVLDDPLAAPARLGIKLPQRCLDD
jgi:DNA processing protein